MNTVHDIIGEKPYHSIGHLPGSRVGPGDHKMQEGQARCFLELQDYRERIAVTEKLDGTCVSVIRQGYEMLAVQRNGHLCSESPYEMHHKFAEYVKQHETSFSLVLSDDGDRIVGEWVAQAHGIVYDNLPDMFFAFDLKEAGEWLDTLTMRRKVEGWGISTVPLIHYGMPLASEYWSKLTKRSAFRKKGPAEGLVFRRELDGQRIDIAKWVRADHTPGKFLPGTDRAITDTPVWNTLAS